MIELIVVVRSWSSRFTYDEYGVSSMGSWSYSYDLVWNLRAKLCCITSGM